MPTCEKVRRSVLKNTRSPGLSSSRLHLDAGPARWPARRRGAAAPGRGCFSKTWRVKPLQSKPSSARVAAAAVGHAEEVHRREHHVRGRVAHLAARRLDSLGGTAAGLVGQPGPRSASSCGDRRRRRRVGRRRHAAAAPAPRAAARARRRSGQAGIGAQHRRARRGVNPKSRSRDGHLRRHVEATSGLRYRVVQSNEETRMFKALLLEKDDAGFRAGVRDVDEAAPARAATCWCAVEYSTLNYKDGLAHHQPRRRWCATGRWCAGIDGAGTVLESTPPGLEAGRPLRAQRLGRRRDALGLPGRARAAEGRLAGAAARRLHAAPGDGHRHRRLHRDAVRAGAGAPRRRSRATARCW